MYLLLVILLVVGTAVGLGIAVHCTAVVAYCKSYGYYSIYSMYILCTYM